MTEWLNTRDLYVQYAYEDQPKRDQLIKEFGFCFDDQYFYWNPKKRPDIVKRAPIWLYPKKSIPMEKPK